MKRLGGLAFACLLLISFSPVRADDLDVTTDIVYGKGGDTDLKLDLIQPAKRNGKLPGMIVIHGGGWKHGNKGQLRLIAEQLARAGYVACCVQYRLSPQARFPSQVEDVKCSVRWLRAHADEYSVDADHIGAIGASAGGHLSLMLGLMDTPDGLEGEGGNPKYSSKVQAVANFFGPADLTRRDWDKNVEPLLIDFLGGTVDEQLPAYKQASPVTYVDAKDPPILTFHGTKDNIVPFGQAEALDKLLKEKGVETHLEVMKDAGHGWLGEDLQRTHKMAIEFFDKHLKTVSAN